MKPQIRGRFPPSVIRCTFAPKDWKRRFLSWRHGTFAILLVEIAVAIIHARELSLDEEVAHLSFDFERIAVGHNNVCHLSCFESADLIGEPEELRGIQHYGLQGFVMR